MKISLMLLLGVILLAGCRRGAPAQPAARPTPESNALREAPATVPAPASSPFPTTTATAGALATASATPAPTQDVPATATVFIEQPTGTPTPATATPDPAGFGLGEKYQLYVSYAFEPPADTVEAQQTRAVIVAATVANKTATPVRVTRAAIALIGSDGRRYQPTPDVGAHTPGLLDEEIRPGESYLGLLLFNLPAEVAPDRLIWCPASGPDCVESLQAPIP